MPLEHPRRKQNIPDKDPPNPTILEQEEEGFILFLLTNTPGLPATNPKTTMATTAARVREDLSISTENPKLHKPTKLYRIFVQPATD